MNEEHHQCRKSPHSFQRHYPSGGRRHFEFRGKKRPHSKHPKILGSHVRKLKVNPNIAEQPVWQQPIAAIGEGWLRAPEDRRERLWPRRSVYARAIRAPRNEHGPAMFGSSKSSRRGSRWAWTSRLPRGPCEKIGTHRSALPSKSRATRISSTVVKTAILSFTQFLTNRPATSTT